MDSTSRPLLLVCDDDAGPRLSLRMMLHDKCGIVLTDAPASALAVARHQRFDCAVIDWSMPQPGQFADRACAEGAGARLLRDLHQLDADLAVIIWTAYGDDTRESAIALGAFSTMPKPVDPDVLEREVFAAAAATRARRSEAQQASDSSLTHA